MISLFAFTYRLSKTIKPRWKHMYFCGNPQYNVIILMCSTDLIFYEAKSTAAQKTPNLFMVISIAVKAIHSIGNYSK